MRLPAVMRENASATATAYRSSRIISIGTPSRPSALFTRQTGKVETQPTPSSLRMRLMPVATSIVMDVVSFAWSRAVSLRVGTEAYNHHPDAVNADDIMPEQGEDGVIGSLV